MGEWLELDLTSIELKRLDAVAAKQNRTTEEIVSKIARQEIRTAEDLGARVAFGPESLDTREPPA